MARDSHSQKFSGGQVNVALLGLGTVGTGVIKALRQNAEKHLDAFGGSVEITGILVKDMMKPRSIDIDKDLLFDNYKQLVSEREFGVVIEVIGGIEPAKSIIIDSLQRKRHVITANKELMAKHGGELLEIAEKNGVHLLYEASVGGGIPLIGTMSQFLRFNEITTIEGILNGTTNYMLTKMMTEGLSYESALREAQALGFAEADPTSDVSGQDSMFKLLILSQLAWGVTLKPEQVDCKGITDVTVEDIRFAIDHESKWKLIASAKRDESGHIVLSVGPELVSAEHPLNGIDYEFNAVSINGNIVGQITLSGQGAGAMPTSSAILGDLSFALTHPVHHSYSIHTA